MHKPRIFLGSSGKQAKLLQALTRGLEDVARVEPWTTSFNPGTTTLERLVELAHEVDFTAFVFARDDWTSTSPATDPSPGTGQDSPRDNVVFEAGLFGGVLGMRRTFILHAHGAKLPSDLLGLTCIRYGDAIPAEMRVVNGKLRQAIESEGRLARIEGLWWQFSLTERGPREPSAVTAWKPSAMRLGSLRALLPVFLSYVLSFIYLSIYWNNHHHMLSVTHQVSGGILWANLHLLFWLSLIPFASGWMGENRFAPVPTALYGVILLLAACAYLLLQHEILVREGPHSVLAAAVGRDWKGRVSPLLYALGIALAFLRPWMAGVSYGAVALMWLVPDRRIERKVAHAHR